MMTKFTGVCIGITCFQWVNTLRPRWNGCHFPDEIFKCIFLNENVCFTIKISLTFVPSGQINNIPALVQIMALHRSDDKALSEPMMVNVLTHICITRPQWVKWLGIFFFKQVFNLNVFVLKATILYETALVFSCVRVNLRTGNKVISLLLT